MVGGTLFFLPALRIRGTYFALVTLAFMEILYELTKVVAPKRHRRDAWASPGIETIGRERRQFNNFYVSASRITFAVGIAFSGSCSGPAWA